MGDRAGITTFGLDSLKNKNLDLHEIQEVGFQNTAKRVLKDKESIEAFNSVVKALHNQGLTNEFLNRSMHKTVTAEELLRESLCNLNKTGTETDGVIAHLSEKLGVDLSKQIGKGGLAFDHFVAGLGKANKNTQQVRTALTGLGITTDSLMTSYRGLSTQHVRRMLLVEKEVNAVNELKVGSEKRVKLEELQAKYGKKIVSQIIHKIKIQEKQVDVQDKIRDKNEEIIKTSDAIINSDKRIVRLSKLAADAKKHATEVTESYTKTQEKLIKLQNTPNTNLKKLTAEADERRKITSEYEKTQTQLDRYKDKAREQEKKTGNVNRNTAKAIEERITKLAKLKESYDIQKQALEENAKKQELEKSRLKEINELIQKTQKTKDKATTLQKKANDAYIAEATVLDKNLLAEQNLITQRDELRGVLAQIIKENQNYYSTLITSKEAVVNLTKVEEAYRIEKEKQLAANEAYAAKRFAKATTPVNKILDTVGKQAKVQGQTVIDDVIDTVLNEDKLKARADLLAKTVLTSVNKTVSSTAASGNVFGDAITVFAEQGSAAFLKEMGRLQQPTMDALQKPLSKMMHNKTGDLATQFKKLVGKETVDVVASTTKTVAGLMNKSRESILPHLVFAAKGVSKDLTGQAYGEKLSEEFIRQFTGSTRKNLEEQKPQLVKAFSGLSPGSDPRLIPGFTLFAQKLGGYFTAVFGESATRTLKSFGKTFMGGMSKIFSTGGGVWNKIIKSSILPLKAGFKTLAFITTGWVASLPKLALGLLKVGDVMTYVNGSVIAVKLAVTALKTAVKFVTGAVILGGLVGLKKGFDFVAKGATMLLKNIVLLPLNLFKGVKSMIVGIGKLTGKFLSLLDIQEKIFNNEFIRRIKDASKEITAIALEAEKFGISVQKYSEFNNVLKGLNITSGSLTMILNNINEAQIEGGDQALKIVKALGLDYTAFINKQVDAVDILEMAIKQASSGTLSENKKIKDAIGATGQMYASIFQVGENNFNKMRKTLRQAGVELTDDMVKNAKVTTSAITVLETALANIKQYIFTTLAPYLTNFTNFVLKNIGHVKVYITVAMQVVVKTISELAILGKKLWTKYRKGGLNIFKSDLMVAGSAIGKMVVGLLESLASILWVIVKQIPFVGFKFLQSSTSEALGNFTAWILRQMTNSIVATIKLMAKLGKKIGWDWLDKKLMSLTDGIDKQIKHVADGVKASGKQVEQEAKDRLGEVFVDALFEVGAAVSEEGERVLSTFKTLGKDLTKIEDINEFHNKMKKLIADVPGMTAKVGADLKEFVDNTKERAIELKKAAKTSRQALTSFSDVMELFNKYADDSSGSGFGAEITEKLNKIQELQDRLDPTKLKDLAFQFQNALRTSSAATKKIVADQLEKLGKSSYLEVVVDRVKSAQIKIKEEIDRVKQTRELDITEMLIPEGDSVDLALRRIKLEYTKAIIELKQKRKDLQISSEDYVTLLQNLDVAFDKKRDEVRKEDTEEAEYSDHEIALQNFKDKAKQGLLEAFSPEWLAEKMGVIGEKTGAVWDDLLPLVQERLTYIAETLQYMEDSVVGLFKDLPNLMAETSEKAREMGKSFSKVFDDVIRDAVAKMGEDMFKKGFSDIVDQSVKALKDGFSTIAMGTAAAMAVVGMLLSKTKANITQTHEAIDSMVESTEAVRGVISGETTVALKEVQENLRDALIPTNSILKNILTVLRESRNQIQGTPFNLMGNSFATSAI